MLLSPLDHETKYISLSICGILMKGKFHLLGKVERILHTSNHETKYISLSICGISMKGKFDLLGKVERILQLCLQICYLSL